MAAPTLLTCLKLRKEDSQQMEVAALYTLEKPKKEKTVWTSEVTTAKESAIFKNVEEYQTLDNLAKQLDAYVLATEKALRKRKYDDENLRLSHPSCSYVTESCLRAALQRCKRDPKFWSKNGLEYLIKNNYISKSLQGDVFSCIFQYNVIDLLKISVRHIKGISEKCIVKCLKHIIKSVDKSDIDKLTLTLSWDGCPVDLDVAKILLCMIPVSFDETCMTEYLKLLTADEALVFLQFLHYILAVVSPALISNCITDIDVPKEITEKKVFSWVNCLLSAQLMTFNTSPTLKQLVPELKKTLSRLGNFYSDVASLAPYLEHFKSDRVLPKKVHGKYTIETITL
ncbi:nucleolar protein 11-like [Hydractinia symbiolongicarpus]|uniref:nucleolar protein 11-like n=1 Tax=Hydractinia symbiolongicarpus TaxID=13093 RepID=UPI00254F355D|nr:nucleolar protein 11-like [Hydractinia symbiolongicarpus]